MYDVKFTPKGNRDLSRLPKDLQKRVLKKLKFYSLQKNPLTFSKPLIDMPPVAHRFRVGPYRVAFFVKGKTIYIERIRHRRDVYR